MKFRWGLSMLVLVAAALAVPVVLVGGETHSRLLLSDLAQTVGGVFLAGACIHRARSVRGRNAVGWWAGALVGILTASRPVDHAAQVLIGYQSTVVQAMASFSIVVASVAQLGLLARPLRYGPARLMRALDVVAVGVAVAALGWHLIVVQAPATRFDPTMLILAFVAVALPALLGAAWGMVLVANTPPQRNGYAIPLLGAGLASDAAAAAVIAHNIANAAPLFAHNATVISVLAVVLRVLSCTQGVPDAKHAAKKVVSLFWLSVPYLPVVLSIASVAGLSLWDSTVSTLLLWALLGVVTVAMARQFISLVIIRNLVADLDVQRENLDHMAHHDVLTGLTNRASFQQRATVMLTATRPDSMTAVLLLDLDGFKAVNDTHGHAAGDHVLITVGERLITTVRPSDAASRLGGDEFVVLLPNLTDPEDAERIATRIIERLSQPMAYDATTLRVGVSIGIGIAANTDDDLDTVLHYADTALYAAKNAGKNTYRRHTLNGAHHPTATPAKRKVRAS